MAIPGNMLSLTTEMVDPNTSGWTSHLNCTLKLGGGGRNGDGCLELKSAAAGEMQARTVSSYPVIEGTVYQILADASASAQPERVGIRWLDEANAEISVTWSLTTSTASVTWHRVGVAGAAPSGAVRAQVLLSATPTAAAVVHYFENVYLGLPVRVAGNLVPFSVEQAELDTILWTGETNATLSRELPAVSWGSTNYTAGGHVLAITAAAAGAFAASTTGRFPATAGIDYLSMCYLNPPASGTAAAWIELRFHDEAGVQLAAHRSQLESSGTGWYRQRAAGTAPADTASCSVAVGRDTSSAGQMLRLDEVSVLPNPLMAELGTVVPYADYSFEQGVGAWTVASGVATLARTTPWGAQSYFGSYALAITSSTATSSRIQSARYPVTELQSWRPRIVTKVGAGGWTVAPEIRWFDAAGTELSLSGTLAQAVPADSSWWSVSADLEAPAGAVTAQVEYVLTATAVSSTLYADGVSLQQLLPLVDTEAHDDLGMATLTLRELDPGDAITVYREVGGQRTLVRGPDGLLDGQVVTSEIMVIEDYEAPLGVPLRYRIELRGAGAVIPDTRASGLATIEPGSINEAWLKDPSNPHRNMRVVMAATPVWQRPIPQAAYRIRGRRNPVVHSDVRGGLEGDLTVWTRSDAETEALNWLLDSGNILLWQVGPNLHETDMYINVGEVGLPRLVPRVDEAWRVWTLPSTQVDMPATAGVNGSTGRTWQDLLSEFGTWGDVAAAYATWEDVLLGNRIGG